MLRVELNLTSMYEQTLYKVLDNYIKASTLKKKNRHKTWKYGYDGDHDMVIISKTGKIGEIYEIQNLKIALPAEFETHNFKDKKWSHTEYPKELNRIKTIFDWKEYPEDFKEQWYDYIEKEFERRENGFWFNNKSNLTYITGTHYMYLQWSKIDVGPPDFRESNRLFYIFWEACKADYRCFGMDYLKNRRSGFSFMSSGEIVNLATISTDSRYGILSKSGPDAKKMFTDKVVPISVNYPFFFKPIQDGMDRPKTELAYRIPASKLTRRKLDANENPEDLKGLDTTIDWKNTGDNSYDGEKLKLLVHDESGKWERPNNILNNWRVTKTCLRLGSRVIGKCMMGSTSNALDKGGDNFKKLYYASDVTRRNSNGQTASGLYSLFIPMEWNYEGYIDSYGLPVFDTPEKPVEDPYGTPIKQGVIEFWNNEVAGLKDDQDGLNEFYRQFPRTEQHAFRDEAKESLFNLTKIYQQIDHNESMAASTLVTRGNFQWENGIKDTKVMFMPNKDGRFYVSWIPPIGMQNRIISKQGTNYPGNEHLGAFGCDSYDISGTVDSRGSNGAEDVLMACVFYGMPILAENNKPRLLYHFKNRGYRGYSMNRPDKSYNKLSITEREIGGIPNSSQDIMQAHAAAIETYIEELVGVLGDDEMGDVYFQRTLEDWARFNINNRTKHDASISSGLAIMACNRNRYAPINKVVRKNINLGFKRYDNSGSYSKIIN